MEPNWLEELRDAIHQNAVDHGWWPEEFAEESRDLDEVLALMVSEVSELLEAYRHGTLDAECGKTGLALTNLEEELADVAIRLLDLCGHRGISPLYYDFALVRPYGRSFGGQCFSLIKIITQADLVEKSDYENDFWAGRVLMQLMAMYRAWHSFEPTHPQQFWNAVRAKHAYNQGRPHRHGGLKA
jgi:NTP pyrophosphatase (non-canonical NTP hydrolase)